MRGNNFHKEDQTGEARSATLIPTITSVIIINGDSVFSKVIIMGTITRHTSHGDKLHTYQAAFQFFKHLQQKPQRLRRF